MRASIASVTYLNRSQLARILSIAPAMLTKRILAGSVTPDAHDGNGRELFDASLHAPRQPVDVTGYASGIVNNAELLHLTRLDNAATEPVAGTPANSPMAWGLRYKQPISSTDAARLAKSRSRPDRLAAE